MLPDWNSVESTARWSDILFWAGIICLIFLAATEVASHIYGNRSNYLAERERGPRGITADKRAELIALLTPIPISKDLVSFNPLMTDGEAVAFSDQIKDVLSAAGFQVNDVPFGDRLFSLNRLGVYLWYKDPNKPPKRAQFIAEAFRRVGIRMLGDPQPNFPDDSTLVIVVGAHP